MSTEQSDEPGEYNGNNFSYQTTNNIRNLPELWLTRYLHCSEANWVCTARDVLYYGKC